MKMAALDYYIQRLRSWDGRIQNEAIDELKNLRSLKAVVPLATLAAKTYASSQRDSACKAIVYILDPELHDLLYSLVYMQLHKFAEVNMSRWANVADRIPIDQRQIYEAIPHFLKVLESGPQEASWAALALGFMNVHNATEPMIGQLDSPYARKKWGIAIGLGLLGEFLAESALANLYRGEKESLTRLAAIKGLECIESTGATEVIQEALKDSLLEIRYAARLALRRRGMQV